MLFRLGPRDHGEQEVRGWLVRWTPVREGKEVGCAEGGVSCTEVAASTQLTLQGPWKLESPFQAGERTGPYTPVTTSH